MLWLDMQPTIVAIREINGMQLIDIERNLLFLLTPLLLGYRISSLRGRRAMSVTRDRRASTVVDIVSCMV